MIALGIWDKIDAAEGLFLGAGDEGDRHLSNNASFQNRHL